MPSNSLQKKLKLIGSLATSLLFYEAIKSY